MYFILLIKELNLKSIYIINFYALSTKIFEIKELKLMFLIMIFKCKNPLILFCEDISNNNNLVYFKNSFKYSFNKILNNIFKLNKLYNNS